MKSMLRTLAILTISASALTPSAASAQKVSYDYNRARPFTQPRTYTFKDCTQTDDPLVDERIAADVAAQLAARGMTRNDAHPDVYVTTRQTFKTHQEYLAYTSGYPYGWGWGYPYGWGGGYGYDYYGWGPAAYTDVQVRDVTVTTLTVDLKDSSNNQLIWRGVGTRTVHPSAKPSHVEDRVGHQVREIFEHYSPRVTVVTEGNGGTDQ